MSHLYVATNGLSVWTSNDLGETLLRMSTGTGMYSGSQVWALALHPSLPQVLLAGTNTGIYRLDQQEENDAEDEQGEERPDDPSCEESKHDRLPGRPDLTIRRTRRFRTAG